MSETPWQCRECLEWNRPSEHSCVWCELKAIYKGWMSEGEANARIFHAVEAFAAALKEQYEKTRVEQQRGTAESARWFRADAEFNRAIAEIDFLLASWQRSIPPGATPQETK